MELIQNNCSEQIGTKILECLELELKNKIEALLTIPEDAPWLTENYENPFDRVFATMEEASIRSAQIVQLLLNSNQVQSFQKNAEAKFGDVTGQLIERGTYTNADILAQLCYEISVKHLNEVLGENLQIALNSEEEVGALTQDLKPTGKAGENIVVVDPVDGTVYLLDPQEGQKRQPNIRWYSTAFAGTDEQGEFFGQVHIPDKNLTFRRKPNRQPEVKQYFGTANENTIQPAPGQPTQSACINGRVPQSIQNTISNNKKQNIEREKDEPEDKIGWRANGSAIAFWNGEYGFYAVTGKELRDQVILELLSQDTNRFTTIRINLNNQKDVKEETLIVVNKTIKGYDHVISQLNQLNPLQQELQATRFNLEQKKSP